MRWASCARNSEGTAGPHFSNSNSSSVCSSVSSSVRRAALVDAAQQSTININSAGPCARTAHLQRIHLCQCVVALARGLP